MKIIGIIPARYASVRLPGKPLVKIDGMTMIERVYRQAQKSKLIDSVIVATDDKRIYKCVNGFGGEVKMTSVKHQSGTDRIHETVKNVKADIIVNIQGDEPYIDPGNIDKAIEPLISDKKINVSTLAIRIKEMKELFDINKVKVVLDKNNFALYFSRNFIPFDMVTFPLTEIAFRKNIYYKHIGLYVYRKNYLMKFAKMKKSYLESMEKLEQLRILENGEKIKVVLTKKDSISIDTEKDLKLVAKL